MSIMDDTETAYLTGKLLIAMPGTQDPHFKRALVYVCAHSSEGAMGLLVNRCVPDFSLAKMLTRAGVENHQMLDRQFVYNGGPVERTRGFVLHSAEYTAGDATLRVNKGFSMTATMDILEDIAKGTGPVRRLVALGYCGWGPGQLDREMLDNGWLTLTPGPGLVFSTDDSAKWTSALNVLGVKPMVLSTIAGHA